MSLADDEPGGRRHAQRQPSTEVPLEHPAEEVRHLESCINDLISIVALPAVWTAKEPPEIVDRFLGALQTTLRLDLIYVRVNGSAGEAPIELVRVGELRNLGAPAQDVGAVLRHWLGDDPQKWPPLVRNPIGDEFISVVPLRLGYYGEVGTIVAGAERADFPLQTERLLLSVAANQVAIGLQGARLLREQRRLAIELEQRIAQQTSELAAANEALKNEIAEHKLAEERLRQEELKLKRTEARKTAILASALDCIVTINHEGRITEFNPAAERTFGYKRDKIVGERLVDTIIPPPLREKHLSGFARYLDTGETTVLGRRIEITAVRADGSEFPVELTITRIPLDGPPFFTGYLRDITARKQSDEELRRSEAFLAEAQHLSSTGSFSWRVATGEITWSEQLYRIFEFAQGTPVTLERVVSRVHPHDVPTVHDMIARARGGGGEFEFELRLQMPDHSVKYLHMVAHGSQAQNAKPEYIGAIQDVTQRRLSELELGKARSDLAHAVRATSLGVTTASIAHEVNQPLSGIVTNASTCLRMLAASPPNLDGARETARRTIRDANRAADVITRLRALFARKAATTELVHLNDAAREVIALSLSELQRTSVILRSEFADGLRL